MVNYSQTLISDLSNEDIPMIELLSKNTKGKLDGRRENYSTEIRNYFKEILIMCHTNYDSEFIFTTNASAQRFFGKLLQKLM